MVTQAAATPGRQLLQLSFKLFVRQVLTCHTPLSRSERILQPHLHGQVKDGLQLEAFTLFLTLGLSTPAAHTSGKAGSN